MEPKYKKRSVYALIATQLFLAFSDNAIKGALGIFLTFSGFSLFGLPSDVGLLVSALIFVCPYFFCAAIGGVLADTFDNSKVIKWTRALEMPLALLAGFSIYQENMELLVLVLFTYSVQSSIFTAAKLSILPKLASDSKLVSANAGVQTSTLLGVLLGLVMGGVLVSVDAIESLIGVLLLSAFFGALSAMQVSTNEIQSDRALVVSDLNPILAPVKALRLLFVSSAHVQLALMVTWFWILGLVLTSLLPDVAKQELNISALAANVLIGGFVIGIAIGGAIVSKISDRFQMQKLILISLISMAIFLFDLSFAVMSYATYYSGSTADLSAFLQTFGGLRILFDLCLIAIFGAIYIAPLYAKLQSLPFTQSRSKMLSGSVTMDALASTFVAAILAVAFGIGLSFGWLLILLAATNIIVALFVYNYGEV